MRRAKERSSVRKRDRSRKFKIWTAGHFGRIDSLLERLVEVLCLELHNAQSTPKPPPNKAPMEKNAIWRTTVVPPIVHEIRNSLFARDLASMENFGCSVIRRSRIVLNKYVLPDRPCSLAHCKLPSTAFGQQCKTIGSF